jgi:hypothetical protein
VLRRHICAASVGQLRGISRISKDSTMSPISMFW